SWRVDGPDVLGRGAAVQGVVAGVGGGCVDDDPVVLLTGEDVGGALRVLVHAGSVREVELDRAGGDRGVLARGDGVAGVRRDLAVVLVGDVAAGVRRVLQRHRGVLLRQQVRRRRAVAEALRVGLVVGRGAADRPRLGVALSGGGGDHGVGRVVDGGGRGRGGRRRS